MNDSYHMYINGSQILMRRSGGLPFARRVEDIDQIEWDVSDIASFQIGGTKGLRAKRLHIYVGSALCRFMAMGGLPGAKAASERRAIALARLSAQLGLMPADWKVAVSGEASSSEFLIVSAIQRSVFEQVCAVARKSGFRPVSFKPFIEGIWNTHLAVVKTERIGAGIFVAIEHDALTLIAHESGRVQSIHSLLHERTDGVAAREIARASISTERETAVQGAVVEHLVASLGSAPIELLNGTDYSHARLCPDFRDLLLQGGVKTK